jgi:hypothetical protein
MDDSIKVVEHLKMIQPIITRMSSAMLSIKAFLLTTFSLLVGLAIKDKILEVFFIVFPLILIFGVLDSFYLWQERLDLFENPKNDRIRYDTEKRRKRRSIQAAVRGEPGNF